MYLIGCRYIESSAPHTQTVDCVSYLASHLHKQILSSHLLCYPKFVLKTSDLADLQRTKLGITYIRTVHITPLPRTTPFGILSFNSSNMASGGASPLPSFPVSRTATPSSNLNPNASRKITICVFCGASSGKNPAHMQAARDLGKVMADNNISLGTLELGQAETQASTNY
jgi:hypothetical protein